MKPIQGKSRAYVFALGFVEDPNHSCLNAYCVCTYLRRGTVTSDVWNTRVLSIAVSVGIVVSIKRLWLGLYLGKKTFGK
jgi:hypothetical protein